MRTKDTIRIGEGGDSLLVEVFELTPNQIRDYLRQQEAAARNAGEDGAGDADLVADLLLEVSFADLARMTNLTVGQMGDIPPRQLDRVVAKCREVNPRFFGLLTRLAKLGETILANGGGTWNGAAQS